MAFINELMVFINELINIHKLRLRMLLSINMFKDAPITQKFHVKYHTYLDSLITISQKNLTFCSLSNKNFIIYIAYRIRLKT